MNARRVKRGETQALFLAGRTEGKVLEERGTRIAGDLLEGQWKGTECLLADVALMDGCGRADVWRSVRVVRVRNTDRRLTNAYCKT